ncbi:hypothetical protein D9M70_502590 [compost metagenome]
MLPLGVIEDVVPGKREVRAGRIDALARYDERGDLAIALAEEGRVGVEEEVRPAEEAIADRNLVAFDFRPAGGAECKHDLLARTLLRRPGGQLALRHHPVGAIDGHHQGLAAMRRFDQAVGDLDPG